MQRGGVAGGVNGGVEIVCACRHGYAMRMSHAQDRCEMGNQGSVVKKPTNVSIRSDLLANARELKVNLSAVLEKSLEDIVRQHRREQWKRENREAIQAYNKFVEEHGVWSDEFRTW